MNPYRIMFKVKPSVNHPSYWELEFGFLNLFLFDNDVKNVARRGMAILAQLPFEMVGERCAVYLDNEATAVEMPWIPPQIASAQNFGFSYYLLAWRIGCDETDEGFLNAPFPHEAQIPEA